MCDDKEMLANNKYIDFKTGIGDEFEEMNFHGHKHEFPSNILSELVPVLTFTHHIFFNLITICVMVITFTSLSFSFKSYSDFNCTIYLYFLLIIIAYYLTKVSSITA